MGRDFTLPTGSLNILRMKSLVRPSPLPEFAIAHFACPGFWLQLKAAGQKLLEIEFLPSAPAQFFVSDSLVLRETAQQLEQWLEDPAYVFSLPITPAGTPFRQKVWAAIATIPIGETRRYGELAKDLNSAPRAVGQACGDNPLPIVIPCHRVVSQTGLGGFNHSSGQDLLGIKRWLLAREQGK